MPTTIELYEKKQYSAYSQAIKLPSAFLLPSTITLSFFGGPKQKPLADCTALLGRVNRKCMNGYNNNNKCSLDFDVLGPLVSS